MTTNTLSVIDFVARESLRVAHEELKFIKTIDRQYDNTYAKTGAKQGADLRVRNPNEFVRRQGSRIMDVQDVTETKVDVTLATQDGVDMRFNSAELSLDIDEFSKRYIEPAMSALVSGIDGDCIATATKGVHNLTGTAGTVLGSTTGDMAPVHNARAALNRFLAPAEDRFFQVDSLSMANVVSTTRALFNPNKEQSMAWLNGYFGRAAGFDWVENERTLVHTVGSGTASLATASDATITDGGGTDDYCTITWSGSEVVSAGDVFTLPKVFACHPETKALGPLMQFVVRTSSTGSTATISPRIYWSGPKQNVCNATGGASVTADFDSETATIVGTNSTAYRRNLAYHKDAFTFVSADLPLMDDAHKCSRMSKDGLSIRVWQASDIRNDELLTRLDILYGFKVMRPSWGVQITN